MNTLEQLDQIEASLKEMRDQVLSIIRPHVHDYDSRWWLPQNAFGEALDAVAEARRLAEAVQRKAVFKCWACNCVIDDRPDWTQEDFDESPFCDSQCEQGYHQDAFYNPDMYPLP